MILWMRKLVFAKSALENFKRYGEKFIRYKANHQTYWYIFLMKMTEIFS